MTRDLESTLKALYLSHRVPVDQYRRRSGFANKFLATWNAASGRDDSLGDLVHFMVTRRKQGKWPKLDGHHRRLAPSANLPGLSLSAWEFIREYYRRLGIGSDNFQFEPKLLDSLCVELGATFNIHLTPDQLSALIIDDRKDGKLGKLDEPEDGDMGFGDLDEVVG